MKIGDEVYIHGYVDEIRKDTVIIRNDGGYFGTVKSEVICGEMSERKKGKWIPSEDSLGGACSECGYYCSAIQLTENGIRNLWGFCPNCGSYNGGGV